MDKRTKRYEVLFTPLEWQRIINAKNHFHIKDTSVYVRRRILEGSVIIEDIEGKREIAKEINAIGNNINQSVRALNSIALKTTASRKDVLEVRLLSQQIQDDQKKLEKLVKERLYARYIKEEE